MVGAIVSALPQALPADQQNIGRFQFQTFRGTFGYRSATTDSAGAYRLAAVAPGLIHLYAMEGSRGDPNSYASFAKSRIRVTTALEAEAGQTLVWNPLLAPGHVIEGLVTYADGQPGGASHVKVTNERTVSSPTR